MWRGVFEEIGRAIGRSKKQELGPVSERLTEASKTLERHGGGPGGSKGVRAAAAGVLAAGGAVGGMVGGAFYAGEEVTSRDLEQLSTQWENYRSSCDLLIDSAKEEIRPALNRALHQELNGISDTLTDTESSVKTLWSIAVGISSGIGGEPPEALSDARWLSDVLRRVTDDNIFLKQQVSDASAININFVSSGIEQRWNLCLAKRIGEDAGTAASPVVEPGTGSAPQSVEHGVADSSNVETKPAPTKRPRLSERE